MACERQRGTIDGGRAYLIAGGLDNAKCVLTFIVLYYFSIASELWWLMLTLTWYLSAGRKWVPEGIDACSSYLHFVAWGVPALLSIAVLITRKVIVLIQIRSPVFSRWTRLNSPVFVLLAIRTRWHLSRLSSDRDWC